LLAVRDLEQAYSARSGEPSHGVPSAHHFE